MTLLPPFQTDRLLPPGRDAARGGGVALVSALAHLAALALVASLAIRPPMAPPEAPSFPLLFAPPAQPATSVALGSATLENASAERLARRIRAPRPMQVAAPSVGNDSGKRANPAALAEPVPGPAPVRARAPAVPAAPEDGAVLARFGDAIQAVVRAAASMPDAAVRQHREGRAQVRFAYLDGHVRAVTLAQSSRSRVLDDAALSAVQTAQYPPPPRQLRGRTLPLLVWVDFRLRASSAEKNVLF